MELPPDARRGNSRAAAVSPLVLREIVAVRRAHPELANEHIATAVNAQYGTRLGSSDIARLNRKATAESSVGKNKFVRYKNAELEAELARWTRERRLRLEASRAARGKAEVPRSSIVSLLQKYARRVAERFGVPPLFEFERWWCCEVLRDAGLDEFGHEVGTRAGEEGGTRDTQGEKQDDRVARENGEAPDSASAGEGCLGGAAGELSAGRDGGGDEGGEGDEAQVPAGAPSWARGSAAAVRSIGGSSSTTNGGSGAAVSAVAARVRYEVAMVACVRPFLSPKMVAAAVHARYGLWLIPKHVRLIAQESRRWVRADAGGSAPGAADAEESALEEAVALWVVVEEEGAGRAVSRAQLVGKARELARGCGMEEGRCNEAWGVVVERQLPGVTLSRIRAICLAALARPHLPHAHLLHAIAQAWGLALSPLDLRAILAQTTRCALRPPHHPARHCPSLGLALSPHGLLALVAHTTPPDETREADETHGADETCGAIETRGADETHGADGLRIAHRGEVRGEVAGETREVGIDRSRQFERGHERDENEGGQQGEEAMGGELLCAKDGGAAVGMPAAALVVAAVRRALCEWVAEGVVARRADEEEAREQAVVVGAVQATWGVHVGEEDLALLWQQRGELLGHGWQARITARLAGAVQPTHGGEGRRAEVGGEKVEVKAGGQVGQEKGQVGQGKGQVGQEKGQVGQEKGQVGHEKEQVGQEKGQVGQEKGQVGQEKEQVGQEKEQMGQEKGVHGDPSAVLLQWVAWRDVRALLHALDGPQWHGMLLARVAFHVRQGACRSGQDHCKVHGVAGGACRDGQGQHTVHAVAQGACGGGGGNGKRRREQEGTWVRCTRRDRSWTADAAGGGDGGDAGYNDENDDDGGDDDGGGGMGVWAHTQQPVGAGGDPAGRQCNAAPAWKARAVAPRPTPPTGGAAPAAVGAAATVRVGARGDPHGQSTARGVAADPAPHATTRSTGGLSAQSRTAMPPRVLSTHLLPTHLSTHLVPTHLESAQF
ncbi:unnamed protein product [Closterium sp. Yama58-4]|nr:unnamed protein product [Closterium sp. Yama58-4]